MPWKVRTMQDERLELVRMVEQGSLSLSEACRRAGVSRTCGHKWLRRFRAQGVEGLADHSRCPKVSPAKTDAALESQVLLLRQAHPAWGGRKLYHSLLRQGVSAPPCPSTITAILRRHGLLDARESLKHQAYTRFEREHPNSLWQMDFKGHVPCPSGRCHPLTVLDDCSRYALVLDACANETTQTVMQSLTRAFERYGLPWQMLMDNGAPWGHDHSHPFTPLGAWLIRLGIQVLHGRPYHPQTQGKEERFHRSFKAELLGNSVPWELPQCQQHFDAWRDLYNWQRPHEALAMAVPGERYIPSARAFPDHLPPIEYAPGDHIRKVGTNGKIAFQGQSYRVPKAFVSLPVALRPQPDYDGVYDVYFCQQKIATIDLKKKLSGVNDVPEHL